MFNLIVKFSRWEPVRDRLHSGRVLQYTSDEVMKVYAPEGRVRFELLKQLPTVFAEETNTYADRPPPPQFARVGRVVDAHVDSEGMVSIEYLLDPEVPPIPQKMLIAMAPALGIEMRNRSWSELGTTHWAVKNADLFKELLLQMRSGVRTPAVFNLPEPQQVDDRQLSAMMPFAGFQPVFEAIIRASEANNMKCNRADNVWEHHEIVQDIVSLIDRSSIVVCDCTSRNANVFYEIGIAHSIGKNVILITQDSGDVPFDLSHLRYIKYLNNGEGLLKLEQELSARIASLQTQRQ